MDDDPRPSASNGRRIDHPLEEGQSTKQPDKQTRVLIVGNDLTDDQKADAILEHFYRDD